MPSLDLQFADSKSLVDTVTGQLLVTFTRASNGTFVGSDGVLRTAANDVPRFDHNPLTGESLGLLVEEARTNLLLNSATLSTQNVTVTAAAHTLSFTGTGTVTLSGTSTAGPLVGTGTGESNRVSLTFTPTAGTLTLTVSGTVSNAQLELGSFRTSYIPTTSATATRSADVASITGSNFSSWYRQDEGTVFAAFRDPGAGGNRSPYFINDGTTNNRIGLFNNVTTTVNHRVRVGGVATDPGSLSLTVGVLNRHAIAVKAETGGAAAACNGTLSTAASPASAPVLTQLAIGSFGGTQDYNSAPISRFCYWPARLPNTTLQALTQ